MRSKFLPKRDPAAYERRRWPRFAFAIPAFVQGTDDGHQRFFMLATILNFSAGGALITTLSRLPVCESLSLLLPTGPLPAQVKIKPAMRPELAGRVIRLQENEGKGSMVAMEFYEPLD